MLPFDRLKKSNTIENLWLYILFLVKESSPNNLAYAYELRDKIEKKFGFKPGEITAYRVLYRLEADGFVKSSQIDRKRIYQITERGLNELKQATKFFKELSQTLN